jgi:transposase-like protein
LYGLRSGGYEQVKGFLGFMDRFPDEQTCRDFLFERRWPDGFACPECGSREHYFIKTRELFECKDCKRQTSLTAGTVMEKTRTPLTAWFWVMFLMAEGTTGVSVLWASRLIGISYKRAWFMAQKIRSAMAERDGQYLLEGVVELDDSYFGGKRRPGKRGRGAAGKVPVLVGVTIRGKGPGTASMRVLDSVSVIELKRACEKMIKPGSTVMTDGFLAYNLALSGYTHKTKVIHDPKSASSKLPWVHILIANAKGTIRGVHHGVTPKNLQGYLSEFCWRFSRRNFNGELFDRLLYACIKTTQAADLGGFGWRTKSAVTDRVQSFVANFKRKQPFPLLWHLYTVDGRYIFEVFVIRHRDLRGKWTRAKRRVKPTLPVISPAFTKRTTNESSTISFTARVT